MSATGLSFRCRRPLPVGAHVEILVDWPAKHHEADAMALLVTGFIVRSDGNRTAVRITSRRFRVSPMGAVPESVPA